MKQNAYQSILARELAQRAEKNPRYSLRAMARALGLAPGAFSEIMAGKRIPSYKGAERILAALDLSPEDRETFFSSLAKCHQERGLERVSPKFSRKFKSSRLAPRDLSVDLFRVIGDWYHYAILMLTYVSGFNEDPRWVAAELGISPLEAKLAIERLLEVGLLKRENGHLVCWSEHFTTADKQLTSAGLRRRQKQILEKSAFSLENDPIDERSHTAMTMAIDPRKLPEARKLIEEFTNNMCALLESGRREQVYEMNIGLFPLQRSAPQRVTDIKRSAPQRATNIKRSAPESATNIQRRTK